MTGPDTAPEGLLDQLHALRQLARQLVRDPHAAEDAVQDACLAALRRPAPARTPLRAWLGAILRNAVRQRARADQRRRRREAHAAAGHRGTTVPSAAEAAAELALHRRLFALVHELEEPARHTIFLRFWRGLPPAAIAALLGVPVKTVHARIERALARLRARLDAERGGRAGWAPLLATTAVSPATAAASWLALLLMKTKLWIALPAAAAVLALLPWSLPLLSGSDAAPTAPPGLTSPASAPGAPTGPAAGEPAGRTAVSQAAAPAPHADAPATVSGVVQDLQGRPVPSVAIVFERAGGDGAMRRDPAIGPATSGTDGRFVLDLPDGEGRLAAAAGPWASVRCPWLYGRVPQEPPVVLVAPARSYAGTVVDAQGQPLAGARLVVDFDDLVPMRAVGGRTVALPNDLAATASDGGGAFRIERVGFVPGARLRAEFEPLRAVSLPLPDHDASDLRLQLGAAAPDDERLHGVVLGPTGGPVAGAFVAVGGETVRTAADGRFAAPWAWRQRPTLVRAAHPEHGAVQARVAQEAGQPGWHPDRPLVLRLPGASAPVTGRVLDAEGRPVAGVHVWTPDLTWLGDIVREEQGHQLSGGGTVEGVAAEGAARWTLSATSAADGTFALRGLMARDYALFALQPGTLARSAPVTARPGENVELRLVDEPRVRVAGRAVSRSGEPLAFVPIQIGRRDSWRPPQRDPDPWADCPVQGPRNGTGHRFETTAATTDADGRFEFAALPLDGTYLLFTGPLLFLPPPVRLADQPDPGDLRVELPARSTFRVELLQPTEATAFRLARDGAAHVPVFVRVEGFEMSVGTVDLVSGRSPPASTEASPAAEIVLLRGEEEVRRVAVALPAGEGHVLRL